MRVLNEPLVHFLAAGAVLFAAYAWLNRDSVEITGVPPVKVGDGEIKWMSETFRNQWVRPPSKEELKGLVTEFVNEQLLAREALEMGLDKDDTIIRRRLAQKLKFLVDDTARLADPNDDVLAAYYTANAARFQKVATVSFTHIYFNPESRTNAEADAKAALSSAPGADAGDRFLLGNEMPDADKFMVESVFGPDFARDTFTAGSGVWTGPIRSSYGVHLVRIDKKQEAKQPALDAVRQEVLAAWRADRQREAYSAYIARLRDKYRVDLEGAAGAVFEDKTRAKRP